MAIKLLHTVIWGLLAATILALPVAGVLRRFRWAAFLTVLVLLECAVLAANGGRCPLSDLAARYTFDRGSNFDIYLPSWLAQHNKVIFGSLFVVNEIIVLWFWRRLAMKQTIKAGVLYFMVVFAVGFVLGVIRTLWVVPKLGARTAELMEAPLMLGASIIAARLVVRRLGLPAEWSIRLASGVIALGLMLLVEFTFVLWVRGLTPREYFASRDPVSGAVYYVTLAAFALIPLFVGKQLPTIAPKAISRN